MCVLLQELDTDLNLQMTIHLQEFMAFFLEKEVGDAPIMASFTLRLDERCAAVELPTPSFDGERALDCPVVHAVQVDSDKALVGGRHLDPKLRPLDPELL